MINELSIPHPEDSDGVLCNRAKIDTGTHCNYKCSFCYYISSLNVVTPFDKIKERIDFVRSQGITEVDLSGGESSIHKDWFKILDYCSDMKISCLSNGYKFSDYEFCKKSKEHGLQEILFSLHGYNESNHDNIVGRNGAYKKILKAIDNAQKLDMIVRINCTVQKDNWDHLYEYADLVNKINPLELNFITLNNFVDQENVQISYTDVTKQIKLALDKLNVKYKNVRYTPFCYMKGYEKYVCSFYQHIYDRYDWNMAMFHYKLDNNKENMFKTAKKNRLREYKKPKKCLTCKYFKICDGIDGDFEVYPEKGNYILDVNHYRRDFYEDG